MYKYYKLLDDVNYEIIIKAKGRNQYRYIYGINEWKETGMLLLYHTEGNVKYEKYEIISESEAYEIIEKKKNTYKILKEKSIEIYCRHKKDELPVLPFDDIETTIVYLLSETVCNTSEVEKLREKGFTERIIKSLCILVENTDYKDEKQQKKLKSDYNTEKILKYKNDAM